MIKALFRFYIAKIFNLSFKNCSSSFESSSNLVNDLHLFINFLLTCINFGIISPVSISKYSLIIIIDFKIMALEGYYFIKFEGFIGIHTVLF